jgi:hypothetical protein
MELITKNMEKFGSILKNYQPEEQTPIFEKYEDTTNVWIIRERFQRISCGGVSEKRIRICS